jgi:hypothetical protein
VRRILASDTTYMVLAVALWASGVALFVTGMTAVGAVCLTGAGGVVFAFRLWHWRRTSLSAADHGDGFLDFLDNWR